jgi:putative oxidoreductase
MAKMGVFMPQLAAWVAIAVELFASIALTLGIWTRPVAILLAVYTIAAGIIGHQYWTMEGVARYGNMINFYKNISIMGGCLLLYVTGAGRYSIDAMRARSRAS